MKNTKSLLLSAALLATSSSAFAQITAGTQLLTNISTWLRGLGITVVTIALMVVGFRMVFQAAEWKDVAPVFWGGVIIGTAATIAGLFINTAGA